MSETAVPAPIPAEGTWSGDPADLPNWDTMPRRNRRRRRRGRYPVWLKYLAWSIGVAVLVTLVQIVVQAVRADPRDAQQYAERQLRLSALRPDERVIASVSVWQRPPIDYFRATRGILVLTDAPGDSARPIGGRLIYLGLQPRDALSPVDAPPTFDVRDWRVDTAVTLEPAHTMFYLARALRLQTPNERLTFGVPAAAEPNAEALRAALERKYAAIRVVGWDRREQRRAEARAAKVANSEGRRPWYHTVRRGEALASIAKMFNTTPEQVRTLNHITGDRIRIGDRLMVKPWTKRPVGFPNGVRPEF
ncbi:MAG TPA: LysM domain-containing protein [Gemmatimonadaceae bacterium]